MDGNLVLGLVDDVGRRDGSEKSLVGRASALRVPLALEHEICLVEVEAVVAVVEVDTEDDGDLVLGRCGHEAERGAVEVGVGVRRLALVEERDGVATLLMEAGADRHELAEDLDDATELVAADKAVREKSHVVLGAGAVATRVGEYI